MDAKVLLKITEDFDFLLSHKNITVAEVMTAINGYLFALAQHEVITPEEQKYLGNIVLNAYEKTCAKLKKEQEEKEC